MTYIYNEKQYSLKFLGFSFMANLKYISMLDTVKYYFHFTYMEDCISHIW